MALRFVLPFLFGTVLATLTFAADETVSVEPNGSSMPSDPNFVRLHLMDGSMIAGRLSVSELEVETSFGTLKIPIAAIKSFTPGLASHPKLGKQVYDLIENLGSPDYDQRESAQKELTKMGEPIRPELQKRVGDSDKERRERVSSDHC